MNHMNHVNMGEKKVSHKGHKDTQRKRGVEWVGEMRERRLK